MNFRCLRSDTDFNRCKVCEVRTNPYIGRDRFSELSDINLVRFQTLRKHQELKYMFETNSFQSQYNELISGIPDDRYSKLLYGWNLQWKLLRVQHWSEALVIIRKGTETKWTVVQVNILADKRAIFRSFNSCKWNVQLVPNFDNRENRKRLVCEYV